MKSEYISSDHINQHLNKLLYDKNDKKKYGFLSKKNKEEIKNKNEKPNERSEIIKNIFPN